MSSAMSHSWKMVVGNVLTWNGFPVRILEITEDREFCTKMEALNTEFFSQERLVELISLGFEQDIDGKYIYEVKTKNDETKSS